MLSRRRSVICVRKGSMDRFRELKFGDSGFGVCEREARVGGWDA